MRSIRLYQPGSYQIGEFFLLSNAAAHHIVTVLRKTVGEPLILFKGDNIEWDAVISTVQKKKVEVLIQSSRILSRESPLHIHLAQGLSKHDKLDWVIQKGVELGLNEFTPTQSTRAQALKKNKQSHWQDIAINAAEQSGRNQLTLIHETTLFETFLKSVTSTHRWILTPDTPHTYRDYPLPKDTITLLIGPEGGWAPQEVDAAKQAGFSPVTLGPRILRTETAPIVMLSLLQTLSGDF